MTIGVFSVTSSIHDAEVLNKRTEQLLNDIRKGTGLEFSYCGDDFSRYNEFDLKFIFIRTGGSEGKFKELYPSLKSPFYLLTTGENNSLAASMEILSFLRERDEKAEIIHGSVKYVAQRMATIAKVNKALINFRGQNFGVIGKPSDWLISSQADYAAVKGKLGVNIIDVTMDEFIEEIDKNSYPDNVSEYLNAGYDKPTMEVALNIYGALSRLTQKYKLAAITVRCFDLLSLKCNTSCLALAILNKEGITAACEGDVPAMLSMAIIRELTGNSSFQANPSSIDVETNKVTFAHCTIPFDMVSSYTYDTHFESGLGVAVKGEVPTGDATIFKTSGNLSRYFVSNAKLEVNLSNPHLCRTQVAIKPAKNVDYFLKNSIGNHHIIALGEQEEIINEFFSALNT